VRSRIRLRELYIKAIIYAGVASVAMLVGGSVVIAVKEKKAPSSELIETFFETASDIAEVLFENGKP
jgi:hypothetical protein